MFSLNITLTQKIYLKHSLTLGFQEGHYSSSSAARVRCPADDIVNPLNVFRIIANSELRKASEYYEAVQVKPQHVSLKLRISESNLYPLTPQQCFHCWTAAVFSLLELGIA